MSRFYRDNPDFGGFFLYRLLLPPHPCPDFSCLLSGHPKLRSGPHCARRCTDTQTVPAPKSWQSTRIRHPVKGGTEAQGWDMTYLRSPRGSVAQPRTEQRFPESQSVVQAAAPGSLSVEAPNSAINGVSCLSPLEGAGCKICPPDWLPHGAKCYWFSTESKIWARSHEDCSARSALPLSYLQEFLGNSIQEKYLVWTGLSANVTGMKWTWVDGSLFPVKGSAEENSCGVIKGSQIQSETCSGEYRWICQKDPSLQEPDNDSGPDPQS
uniref:C-type lectin domain-containing protein n=1 Tax=Chrysemys picta bellii TaxID=8478 RepID=A0A8C3I024_CHRPI